jgi:hypothetical protein
MRVPWPPEFPDVVIHTDERTRVAHPAYAAAKSGDADAAVQLVIDLINAVALEGLRQYAAMDALLILPVTAEEAAGFNAIPDALADHLALAIGRSAALGEIVQTNKVGHTRAKAFQRLVTPPTFEGYVQTGANYLLVDDHVGLGGTLANLRGHVELNGGRVIAMTALTESRDGCSICLRPETLDMLWEKHGEALDQLWQDQFGYGIGCLTEVEGQILCRQPSVDAIEDFLAQAAVEARRRGFPAAVGNDEGEEGA